MGIANRRRRSDADREARHVTDGRQGPYCWVLRPRCRSRYLWPTLKSLLRPSRPAPAIHARLRLSCRNEVTKRVEEEGLVFIGPSTRPLRPWATRSRQEAGQRGPRSTPFRATTTRRERRSARWRLARGIGYPVMIKASAGGGGKGCASPGRQGAQGRLCRAARTRHATASATTASSSKSSSRAAPHRDPDPGRQPRQRDLPERRECSIQRRHQKVIEEAPSPFISDAAPQSDGRAGRGAGQCREVPVRRDGGVCGRQDQDFFPRK